MDYQSAYQQGYNNGHAGKTYRNPYNANDEAFDGYSEGFDIGQEDRQIEKGY